MRRGRAPESAFLSLVFLTDFGLSAFITLAILSDSLLLMSDLLTRPSLPEISCTGTLFFSSERRVTRVVVASDDVVSSGNSFVPRFASCGD